MVKEHFRKQLWRFSAEMLFGKLQLVQRYKIGNQRSMLYVSYILFLRSFSWSQFVLCIFMGVNKVINYIGKNYVSKIANCKGR